MKTSNLCVRRENATERVTISFIFQLIDLKVGVFFIFIRAEESKTDAIPHYFRKCHKALCLPSGSTIAVRLLAQLMKGKTFRDYHFIVECTRVRGILLK